jgi:conjugal transfer pilus assembly protein TraB
MSRTQSLIQLIKKIDWKKHEARAREIVQKKPLLVGAAFLGLLLFINLFSLGGGRSSRIVERPQDVSFQNGRILNDRESTFYYGKERLLSQKAQTMIETEAKLEARLAELEKKVETGNPKPAELGAQKVGVAGAPDPVASPAPAVQLYPPTSELAGSSVTPIQMGRGRRLGSGSGAGSGLIAFPVKSDLKSDGMVLPSGSYVKAKIMTGVDVPEGKPYPVLLALDYSYVAPNDHKIDLSGCFMIAKAEGDLSTERVQMQATKMSCVSKKGKMFEREVNGFIADDKDASFAVAGVVNSKQGRVAAMAFMSSIVQGVGQAVQAAQTSQSTNALGGSSSVLTGDSTKYMVAGGASNAAGMVAQWYLQQAQALAPTVSVGSGRDVWIVMKDKVDLPQEYFRKEGKPNEGIYNYFSRVLD